MNKNNSIEASMQAMEDYFALFDQAHNSQGALAKTQRIKLAAELIYSWLDTMIWRDSLNSDDNEDQDDFQCMNPCCAPVIMSTGRLNEIALAILGLPSHYCKDVLVELNKSMVQMSATGRPSSESLKEFAEDVAGSVWKTVQEIKDDNYKNPSNVENN